LEKAKLLYLGIKKKPVSFVLPLIFRNFVGEKCKNQEYEANITICGTVSLVGSCHGDNSRPTASVP
jgi:hypothetical protein